MVVPSLPRSVRFLPLLLMLASLAVPASATPADAVAGQVCRGAISVAEREAGIPAGLLQAIGRVESGRRDPATGRYAPWPWTINAEGRGMFFPTREAAIAEVRQLQARGVRIIDVGCMQVNLHHHPNAFASLEDAFDPLTNARYAARFLGELQASRQDWARAAGNYHSNTPDRAEAYRARVLAAWGDEQRGTGGNAAAEAAALAALGAARGGAPLSLANGTDRARVIPLAAGPSGATPGRGLDAYRAAPIMVVGRAPAAVAPIVPHLPLAIRARSP